MHNGWIKSMMRPMATLILALCMAYGVEQYNQSSKISDNVISDNMLSSTEPELNVTGQSTSNLHKSISSLAETSSITQLSEHKTQVVRQEKLNASEKERAKIAEKEKARLAKLVVFSALCGILFYNMNFKKEDNSSVERLNQDPESNEHCCNNDNGFINKWFLLSIASVLAPMQVDEPNKPNQGATVIEQPGVNMGSANSVSSTSDTTERELKIQRTGDVAHDADKEVKMGSGISDLSTGSPSTIEFGISDSESIKAEAEIKENVKSNANTEPLKYLDSVILELLKLEPCRVTPRCNLGVLEYNGMSYTLLRINASSDASNAAYGADLMRKKAILFPDAQSTFQSTIVDRVGLYALWDINHGVGLFINEKLEKTFASTASFSIPTASTSLLLEKYNKLQSGDIKLDENGDLPESLRNEGIELLKPKDGRCSFDFMNPTLNTTKPATTAPVSQAPKTIQPSNAPQPTPGFVIAGAVDPQTGACLSCGRSH